MGRDLFGRITGCIKTTLLCNFKRIFSKNLTTMSKNRVLITGIAAISPLGVTADEHFNELAAGTPRVQVSAEPQFQPFECRLEARVSGFNKRTAITNRTLRKLLSENAAHCAAAVTDALADAGLESKDPILAGCGIYIGSPAININPEIFIPGFSAAVNRDEEFDISLFARRGMKLLDPLFLVKSLPNIGLGGSAVYHQILGSNTNITNGVTSGLQAVALAAAAIRRGEVEFAIAGGYDSLLNKESLVEGIITNELSPQLEDPERACRPFDKTRNGYAVGEGAALLLLESEASAQRRSARVYGELAGIGQTTDPQPLQQDVSSSSIALEQAARSALCQSGAYVDDIDVVFGDGVATEQGDIHESAAVQGLSEGREVPFCAATGQMGYTGAASGAFSLVNAALSMQRSLIPPLINCLELDPRCPVTFSGQCETNTIDHALVLNSNRGQKYVSALVRAY